MLGFEVNGEFYPMKDLILRTGYTHNRARDRSPDRVTYHVVNIPAHKIDAGVSYTVPYIQTRLDFNGIYLGKVFNQLPTPAAPNQATQKIKDYYLANVRISQGFMNYFEAYLALNNIFDKNYESSYGFPGPGRSFYLGITARY
jgi:outer membrane receptor protein involved in Fe transport